MKEAIVDKAQSAEASLWLKLLLENGCLHAACGKLIDH